MTRSSRYVSIAIEEGIRSVTTSNSTPILKARWSSPMCPSGLPVTFRSRSRSHVSWRALSSSPGNNKQSKSTGISYLDTWMGIHNARRDGNVENSQQGQKTAATGALPELASAASPYSIVTVRPYRDDTPESFGDRLSSQLPAVNAASGAMGPQTGPQVAVVLDLSAFHPDGSPHHVAPPPSTLSGYVNAITSSEHFHLVGVTNLSRHFETQARSLNLPILKMSNHYGGNSNLNPNLHVDYKAFTSHGSAGEDKATRRKKRGVAPLRRPRRLGVEFTHDIQNTSKPPMQKAKTLDRTNELNNHSEPPPTKVHKGSLRSGQLLSTDLPNQSLVIIGSVNPGAEVLSEGDVYVFGKLRGRVLAGLGSKGDTTNATDARRDCKIFATSFDPELVCIGEAFTTVDDVGELGLSEGIGPAMVSLNDNGENLVFERIDL